MRLAGFDQFVLVAVELSRSGVGALLTRVVQTAGDFGDHRLDSIGQQLALGVSVTQFVHRTSGRTEVAHILSQPTQARTGHSPRNALLDDVLRHRAGVGVFELLRVVGQQALGNQLQQHIVVTLEGHVDVEVVVQTSQAILGQEALAATRFTRLLDGVERVPGRQRLERGRQGFEILTVVVSITLAREHLIKLDQELVVREKLRVRRCQLRQQSTLVPLVVEQHDFFAIGSGELAAGIAVLNGDGQGERSCVRGGTVE